MQPFIDTPTDDTLDEFLHPMIFGAHVWNLANTASSADHALGNLHCLINRNLPQPQRENALEVARSILLRKLRLFPKDNRIVADLRLIQTDDGPILWATGMAWR